MNSALNAALDTLAEYVVAKNWRNLMPGLSSQKSMAFKVNSFNIQCIIKFVLILIVEFDEFLTFFIRSSCLLTNNKGNPGIGLQGEPTTLNNNVNIFMANTASNAVKNY